MASTCSSDLATLFSERALSLVVLDNSVPAMCCSSACKPEGTSPRDEELKPFAPVNPVLMYDLLGIAEDAKI